MLKDNIKRLREAMNLSQYALGRAVGVHQTMISHIEMGYKIPSLILAKRIADTLNVSLDELLGRETD